MRLEELRRVKNQRPFRPYRIRMADGREIAITHPDAVAWENEHSRVVLALSGGEHHWIEAVLITSLVEHIPASPSEENGGP
jgi:hypothetical protein